MSAAEERYQQVIEEALAALDLDAKAGLLSGQDTWSLPALPQIGLDSLLMSDGPVGVRGRHWSADDPSVALPSPTALAATWAPELALLAGQLLAQEAHRKGVHVLLAPTVNMHRSPLGGRHFECYSEDPYLTGVIGARYVSGVQQGGVATTVKHFVANDAETERFTVSNLIDERTLREVYLLPFEYIVEQARPWGVMAAYNAVNGTTMTEHDRLQNGVLRGEWGFDGFIVSDWMAARDTAAALSGGLDVAMPGPRTVFGPPLAEAVRAGLVPEAAVDRAVRRVLLLAARTGALRGAEPAVPAEHRPRVEEPAALAAEIARRSLVLVRNEPLADGTPALPLDASRTGSVALIGAAARDARVLGGGSATVFPERVVSPLDGLRAALPEGTELRYAVGADPQEELLIADHGFELRAVCFDSTGQPLGEATLPNGQVKWLGELPEGVSPDELHTVDVTGTFTPRESGVHSFGTTGIGGFFLTVDGQPLFAGEQAPNAADPFEAVFGAPVERGTAELSAGEPVEVSLRYTVARLPDSPVEFVGCSLMHREPQRDGREMIAEAVQAAAGADAAVVVVATTERVESEGFDRTSLALPGLQDELVRAVTAVNPRTIVVVNSGAPVELAWREQAAAVLLGWFGGQEAGTALADVLLGAAEPGGRLPTSWPAALSDAPVTDVVPRQGQLPYSEGGFIGYRGYQRAGRAPAYWFGHGLGYTDWEYQELAVEGRRATVRVRNAGARAGRETVQLYATAPQGAGPEYAGLRLAGFGQVSAEAGGTAELTIELPERAFQFWDNEAAGWRTAPGGWTLQAGRSAGDLRLTAVLPAR